MRQHKALLFFTTVDQMQSHSFTLILRGKIVDEQSHLSHWNLFCVHIVIFVKAPMCCLMQICKQKSVILA